MAVITATIQPGEQRSEVTAIQKALISRAAKSPEPTSIRMNDSGGEIQCL
jgi:hypothetical protein